MTIADEPDLLTEVETVLKKRFNKDAKGVRVPSTARVHTSKGGRRVDQLVLPDDERAKMPVTKDKYLVKENPHMVQWERETRKFLRRLTPQAGHRVSAIMVYEWATGINVADLYNEGGNCNTDLRAINKVLRHYFGKPYMTYILGRKVERAYRVRPGYLIKRHRPMTLTLWYEYSTGVLNP